MLKKWFMLLIVLSFAVFAVSSGCSDKSKENITKNVVENTKENITKNVVENAKENITQGVAKTNSVNSSADKVVEGAKTLYNDSGNETKVKVELTGSSGEKTNISVESTGNLGETSNANIESTGSPSDWCTVGSSWQTFNPLTNEEVTMTVAGIEIIDGTPMCKSVNETSNKNGSSSRSEILQSQDGKTKFWIAYNASGGIIHKVSIKDGKIEEVPYDSK